MTKKNNKESRIVMQEEELKRVRTEMKEKGEREKKKKSKRRKWEVRLKEGEKREMRKVGCKVRRGMRKIN